MLPFQLIQTSTVRHPLDQWLSLSCLGFMKDSIAKATLTPASFLQGYLEFARHCQKTEFVRYEDFTHNPKKVMQQICRNIDVKYDPTFISRWHSNTRITGDVISTRGGNRIKPLQRRNIDRKTIAAFESEPSYYEALQILQYES